MTQVLKQISITVSIIALIAIITGVSGLFYGWSIPKSINIVISGTTGLIISSSFLLTIQNKSFILRLIQISLMILLIFSSTKLNLDQVFYFALSFNILWIVTLAMSLERLTKLTSILLISLTALTLVSLLLFSNVMLYVIVFIILIYSSIELVISAISQSR